MRTWRIVTVAAICATVLLAGCAKDPGMSSGDLSKSGSKPAGSTTGGSAAPAPAPSTSQPNADIILGPLKVGDSAEFKGLVYTLKEIIVDQGGTGITPGNVVLYAHFTVKNGTKAQVLVTSFTGFKLSDPPGAGRYSKSLQADRIKGEPLDGYVKVGDTMDGWVGFSVKPAAGAWTLEVIPFSGGKASYKYDMKI